MNLAFFDQFYDLSLLLKLSFPYKYFYYQDCNCDIFQFFKKKNID